MNLPPHALQYEQSFDASGEEFAIEPALLAAVCEQESLFGRGLTPKGPGGTGDFTPRHETRVSASCPVRSSGGLVTPVDGLGWGRGLMQLDWASHPEFWSSDIWKVPSWNIHEGARELFERLLTFHNDEYLALLAYNAGANFVRHVLDRVPTSNPDKLHHAVARYMPHDKETGLNYAEQVFARRDKLNATQTKE